MKPKNGNYKLLYQDTKKRREKHKNSSLKASSSVNDDSLDQISNNLTNSNTIRSPNNNKNANNEQINEQDLKQLRTCISNQFKKSNFINFSSIKNQSTFFNNNVNVNLNNFSSKQSENKNDKSNNSNFNNFTNFNKFTNFNNNIQNHSNLLETKLSTQISQSQTNKNKIFTSHNRSQSCPFIEPLYLYDHTEVKDGKNNQYGQSIVSQSMKIQKQGKKKISIQHLNKNRNKFNLGGSADKKNITHNYSNSLTQSSNTVIVHNVPNQIITHHIAPNQNLSSILYKKVQEQSEEQTKTKKENSKHSKRQIKIKSKSSKKSQKKDEKEENIVYRKQNEEKIFLKVKVQKQFKKQKKSQISQKTLHKKSLAQIRSRHEFVIKTKLQQKIKKYQIKQQLQKVEGESRSILIKQDVLEDLLKRYDREYHQRCGRCTEFFKSQQSIESDNQNNELPHQKKCFNFSKFNKIYLNKMSAKEKDS